MRTFLYDGVKNIELPRYPDSAWTFYSNAPEDVDESLWNQVAAVFRVVQMTADAMASLPFVFVKGSDTEWDTSEDYQNKLGFLPNPQDLFRLWRQSLFMTNSAYGFMERGPMGLNLRYIVPTTIEPIVDAKDGIKEFKRHLGDKTLTYPYKQGAIKNTIFPIWRLDYTTELMPSKNTEFKALMQSAGILYYTDFFVRDFYKRGGVVPSIIGVKGVTNQVQQEKIERAFDKLIRNIYKYVAQVWNSEAIDVKPIGQGVESLQKTTLYENAISNVAMAAGMPLSLLLSNSANYATAVEEKLTWFNNAVIPWTNWFSEVLNRELFNAYDVELKFQPEQTDEGTQDEAARAAAFASYVNAGVRPSVAAQFVGIEMPTGIEYDDLDEMRKEDKEEAIERQKEVIGNNSQNEDKEEPKRPDEAPANPRPPRPVRSFDIEQARELTHWQTIATRRVKKGKPLDDLQFETRSLPADIGDEIRTKLTECKTVDDVSNVFETITEPPEYMTQPDNEIKALADALNRLAEKADPQSIALTLPAITVNTPEHNYTFSPSFEGKLDASEIKSGDVYVTVQPTPFQNNISVEPTPILNKIDVQPAPVKVSQPKKARLVRGKDGIVEGIETE